MNRPPGATTTSTDPNYPTHVPKSQSNHAHKTQSRSYTGVEVVPILPDATLDAVEIPESDIEFSASRAGGAGGQNVNKVGWRGGCWCCWWVGVLIDWC